MARPRNTGARLAGGVEDRFPGYDVAGQAGTWDALTAGVVLGRLAPPAPLRFFTPTEEPTARALLDRLLAQDEDPRVPVLEMIDARLVEGQTDGWHYADLPADGEAWRISLAALDADAAAAGGDFVGLEPGEQNRILEAVRTQEADWHGLPGTRVFALWMRYACTAFYSHPWAWNEIGFGGPAYPRGYKNAGLGKREPWEVAERDASDPVPWAARVEAARRRHQ